MSQVDQAVIRASGLGLEDMTAEEIQAMLDDDDGDDFANPPPQQQKQQRTPEVESYESPDWDMDDALFDGGQQGAMTSNGVPLAGVQLVMDVGEDDGYNEGTSYIPLTQIDARVGWKREKHFEVLDFDDD